MLKNEINPKTSGSELADTKKTIQKFIETLYGSYANDGHLAIWTKQTRASHFFTCDEFEKATNTAQLLCKGMDVYFGVGLQEEKPKDGGRGTADSVVCIPGLWLDIDVKGPNHKEDNLPPDNESALKLLESFNLEPTLIVSTGGGFHVYWLFDEPMYLRDKKARDKAKDLSKRFQNFFIDLAASRGWKIDNTSDLSRVLRLSGTYNHKQDDPVLVETVRFNDSNRYSAEEIEEALDKHKVAPADDIPEGSRNTSLASIAGELRGDGKEYEEIYNELLKINESRCKPPMSEPEVNEIAKSISSYEPNSNRRQSPSQRLVNLADSMVLFHTPDKQCYAVVPVGSHKEVLSIKGRGFRTFLSKMYYDQYSTVPGSQGLNNAIGVLQGKALYECKEEPTYIRVAGHNGCIYLDLCNECWEIVRISGTGWEIVKECPVHFIRSDAMAALPRPIKKGKLSELLKFINVNAREEWILIVSFLYGSLNPSGPYPILILQGEQGSAKSTTARLIRDLVDPSSSPLRTLPRNERDLMISAKNNWLLCFDNLSGLNSWLSDSFCRLSTGGGLSTRGLYSDSNEIVFDSTRPIILNGIDQIARRNDLMDRSLIVNLPRIPKEKRRLERELWKEFESAKPRILGRFLDAVSYGLKNINNVRLGSYPRMADFAKWVVAAEPMLPWHDGEFMKVYEQNLDDSALSVLESDLVAVALMDLLAEAGTWEGTATQLLSELKDHDDDSFKRSKSWPKTPSYLANRLNRIAESIRKTGIDMEQKIVKGRKIWSFKHNAN